DRVGSTQIAAPFADQPGRIRASRFAARKNPSSAACLTVGRRLGWSTRQPESASTTGVISATLANQRRRRSLPLRMGFSFFAYRAEWFLLSPLIPLPKAARIRPAWPAKGAALPSTHSSRPAIVGGGRSRVGLAGLGRP